MRFTPNDMTPERLREIQNESLRWTMAHVNTHSEFYREKLAQLDISTEDIQTVDDLPKLPFTDKEDLQSGYPLPLRSVPVEEIVRIHASSGTTGKRKILCYTQGDIDLWGDLFARCYETAGLERRDRVQIAVGYGLWTAGVGFQAGAERFGAMAIPVGPANADMHCEMMVDLGATVFCATASMALLMAEEINRRRLLPKIKVKKIILGAERHSRAMRTRIQELMQVEHIFDIYGLTELYGPGTGLDCPEHTGIHYWSDAFIFEIIDPVSLKPLPPGQPGELVVTTLRKEGSPLIRYRTHDITRLLPHKACSCGSPFPKHDRINGRTDDMFTYRAVNIFPSQIDHVLSEIDGIGSEFQIHLNHHESGRDIMTIMIERAPESSADDDIGLIAQISDAFRRKILVRGEVQIVAPGSLPRTQRKARRVFDYRDDAAGFVPKE